MIRGELSHTGGERGITWGRTRTVRIRLGAKPVEFQFITICLQHANYLQIK